MLKALIWYWPAWFSLDRDSDSEAGEYDGGLMGCFQSSVASKAATKLEIVQMSDEKQRH